jgi:16S rRNA (cytosine967-C5)-methyltransferase
MTGRSRGAPVAPRPVRGPAQTARGLALHALVLIERESARANVVVPELLGGSGMEDRDRRFVTELVYGTLRMQRACDWLVDRHLRRPVEPPVRAALRLGAYQLAFLGTPAHAGVSATVAEVKGPARGLVNAILRRVAEDVTAGVVWPNEGVRLSYPDWIVASVTAALGADTARDALAQMNVAGAATARADGYIQDQASQWVAEAVAGVSAGGRVLDLCAAPGGKATWLAQGGPALVVAADVQPARATVIAANVGRLELSNVATIVADGLQTPFPRSCFDAVLVDAPCSGLGVLRRRPDARWRVHPDDVARLADLQRHLLDSALELVRPGGVVVYSVCTMTAAETTEIDQWLAAAHPVAPAIPLGGPQWDRTGRGARLLPQTAGTDGMYLLAVRG